MTFMVRIYGLDIPSGLEDAFYKIFATFREETAAFYRYSPSKGDSKKKLQRNIRSLFVLWQSLYDGFDSGRKSAWTTYWGTLPFGSHSGGGGWPGSGFSAFVYLNAPLYKAGMDLMLDPPSGGDLITNGIFDGNADGWNLDGGTPVFYYTDGTVHGPTGLYDPGNPAGRIDQEVAAADATTYAVSIDLQIPDGSVFLLPVSVRVRLSNSVNGDGSDPSNAAEHVIPSNGGVMQTYTFSLTAWANPDYDPIFSFYVVGDGLEDTDEIVVDNISCIG